jgi:fermentation-respiration switch protein FrsA (DUF1100 family)
VIEREFTLDSGGIPLRGAVVLPRGDGDWPLVVLCHGIPSGAPAQGDPGYEALARRLAQHGAAACFFNFRGTGLSGGDFSLPGWVSDLEAILDTTRSPHDAFEGCDPARTALMGFSGGGAVGIICAARGRELAGLAALSSPSDFSRMLPREAMGDFIAHARAIGIIRDPGYPPSEEEYYREMLACAPVDVIDRLTPTPLLIVHGDLDDTVPVQEAYDLYEAAVEPKELFVVGGGGHKLRLNVEAMDKAVTWLLERLGTNLGD